jgi:hypothetical protein
MDQKTIPKPPICAGCKKPMVEGDARYTLMEPEQYWHYQCRRPTQNPLNDYRAALDRASETLTSLTGRKPRQRHGLRHRQSKTSPLLRKLLEGLASLGYTVQDGEPRLIRHLGQAMMNKAAGEAAPTWEVCDATFAIRGEPLLNHIYPMNIGSHHPLSWVLKFPPDQWSFDTEFGRLHITAPNLPPHWVKGLSNY